MKNTLVIIKKKCQFQFFCVTLAWKGARTNKRNKPDSRTLAFKVSVPDKSPMKKNNLLHSDEASSFTQRQKILLLSTLLQVDVENCQLTTSAKWQTTSLIALRACLSWWAAVMLDCCGGFALRASLKAPASHAQTWSSFGALFCISAPHLALHTSGMRAGWARSKKRQTVCNST